MHVGAAFERLVRNQTVDISISLNLRSNLVEESIASEQMCLQSNHFLMPVKMGYILRITSFKLQVDPSAMSSFKHSIVNVRNRLTFILFSVAYDDLKTHVNTNS